MPPEMVFVPLLFCERTFSAPEVLLETGLIVLANVCPPLAAVRLSVPPRVGSW